MFREFFSFSLSSILSPLLFLSLAILPHAVVSAPYFLLLH